MTAKRILILVLTLAAFFRFFKLYDWLFFGMDQEYEAFLIRNIIAGKHFPLIGVNASDTGLYLGPAFIYLATIPYALFRMSPVGGAITASLLGIGATFMVYKVGKEWFNNFVGLVAAFLWSASFVSILYDRQFWNPTPIPFLSLVIAYSLTKIFKSEKLRYYLTLGFALGLALQSHLQTLVFVPIIALLFYVNRNKIKRNYLLIFLGIILIFQLPLIIFDLRHNGTNIKALSSIILKDKKFEGAPIQTSIIANANITLSLLGRAFFIAGPVDLYVENGQCKELVPFRGSTHPAVAAVIIFLILFFLYSKLKNNNSAKDFNISLTILLFTLLTILLYRRPTFEYYYLFLLPFIFLMMSGSLFMFWRMKYKIPVLILLGLFLIANIRTFLYADMTFPYSDKVKAMKFIKVSTQDKDYDLRAIGDCGKFGGFRYLAQYYSDEPGASYMDSYFAWLYGDKTKQAFSKTVYLSLLDPREKDSFQELQNADALVRKESASTRVFGNIKVTIVNNEKN